MLSVSLLGVVVLSLVTGVVDEVAVAVHVSHGDRQEVVVLTEGTLEGHLRQVSEVRDRRSLDVHPLSSWPRCQVP